MERLVTPFGEIDILIDGQRESYTVQEGRKLNNFCPDVLGRFQVTVQFIPDGQEHSIACVFIPDRPCERTQESGDRCELIRHYHYKSKFDKQKVNGFGPGF